MLKHSFYLFLIFCSFLTLKAEQFQISEKEALLMLQEADNWIDEMPEGLNDRISDAISHAMQGSSFEINSLRQLKDTTGLDGYKVKIKDLKFDNLPEVKMKLYTSTDDNAKNLLIYFHGGGWNIGSIETSERFCCALAAKGNFDVISVDYPLAPENAYPNGINTCLNAVNFILKNTDLISPDIEKINLGGDGAGGNIALEVFSRIEDKNEINALVLYYPLIKNSGILSDESKRKYGRGFGFDSRLWEAFVNSYQGKQSNLSNNLPPTLLIAPGRDIIIQHEKDFSITNSNIRLIEFEGAVHGFVSDNHQPTAFNKAVDFTDIFLKSF